MQRIEVLEQKQSISSSHVDRGYMQQGVSARTGTEALLSNLLQTAGPMNSSSHAHTPQTSQMVQFPIIPTQAGGTGTSNNAMQQELLTVPPTAPSDIQADGVIQQLNTL